MIQSEFFKAIGYLFFAGIINHIYHMGLDSKKSWKQLLWSGLGFCVVTAGILTALTGRPTCLSRDQDGISSSCEEYADDGFEPTNEQYLSKFVFYMMIGYTPVILAANKKREEHSDFKI